MKFHPPHISRAGHSYAINDDGTAVQINFGPDATSAWQLTGEDAIELRSWLGAAELRTAEQGAALGDPPAEVNPGFKVELDDNKHVHVATQEEAEQLKASLASGAGK